MAQDHHPNVVRTHDLGVFDSMLYLTMELINGEDLQSRLRRSAMPIHEAVSTAIQIADGLSAAHATGVVHRDLKPANVLIEKGGRVVVSDFGIARSFRDDGNRTMGVVGTPLYMAPEQVAGETVDARSDLYAVGLLMFEMLTGHQPFEGRDVLAAAVARVRELPPDPRAFAPLPAWIAELTLCCLARDPADRPPDAQAIASALKEWLAHERAVGANSARSSSSGTFSVAVPATVASPTTNPSSSNPAPPNASQTQYAAPSSPSSPSPSSPLSPRSNPSPIAPIPRMDRSLAVLPLRYIGPKDQEYLGDAIADELIDVLSRTRGIRILASGATERYRSDRDPHAAGTALGVDWIVDGTLQSTGRNIRIAARLVEVSSNAQLWSERFESPLEDLFELQDTMSKRIAEALRAGITTVTYRGTAPPDAIELYLRARRKLATLAVTGPGNAVDMLEQCLAIAPEFSPAIAAHALACLRAWSLPSDGTDPHRWETESRASVARALVSAPEFAETYLAAGMLEVNDGHMKQAVQALVKAITLAPTYAEAQQYLGQLQCEGGRSNEGIKRLELALILDPSMNICRIDLARLAALHDDTTRFDHFVQQLSGTPMHFGSLTLQLRVAIWQNDRERIDRVMSKLNELETPSARAVEFMARVATGEVDATENEPRFTAILTNGNASPRFLTLIYQMITEATCAAGRIEMALQWLTKAADTALIDLEWLNRCPALKPLRELPEFSATRKKVMARVEAIWGT
ncbi:MAG: protein kinase [Polyangiaceae bacterium]